MANVQDARLAELAQGKADAQVAQADQLKQRDRVLASNRYKTNWGANRTSDAAEDKIARDAYNDSVSSTKDAKLAYAEEKGVVKAKDDLASDVSRVEGMAGTFLGAEGTLSRLRDDSAVIEARQLVKDSTDTSLLRDQSTQNLMAQEQSGNRNLLMNMANAGVRGGATAGALTDMSAYNMQNRANMERDLIVQNQNAQLNRAQFETSLAQTDLGREDAEKSMRLQERMGITNYLQAARAGKGQEYLNEQMKSGSGGGSVLCTAMYHHGFMTQEEWYADINAGCALLRNKETRKSFLAYNRICAPLAQLAISSKLVALVISPIILPIAKHFHDNNTLGRILFKVLYSPFKLIGRL